MTDTWLTPDEVTQLTAKKRWSAQCKALTTMGIPFRPNAVGRPLVERAVALISRPASRPKRREPDFSSLVRAI
ncbi:DUF4224 domain-containing protein [Dyella sp.]|uniref:DUF4224 domain-containing protein n=1 Tax=Dyella sp. TaxID=1869338 RepID=UPI002846A1AE|nr:DUF4224 domain-containing protein [Dyella sp.]MDR3444732.1 DUF4224 domain-containing protein [Dyella sp.]